MSRLSFQSLNIVPSEEYSFEDDNAGDLGVWGADPNQFFDFDQCARNSVSPKVEPAALPRNGGNNATYATGNLLNFENPDLDLSLPADMNFVNFDYNLTGFQDIIPTPPQQQQQPEAQPPQLQHIAPPQQISPPQQTRTIIPAVSSARTQKPIAPARPALFDAATIFPAQTATFAPAPTFQPTVPLAPADNLIAPVSEPFAASSASTTTRAPKRKRSISSAATADAQSNYASPESSAGGAGADSLEEASRLAAEEDKRRRNTAASARFRVKKKQKEQQLEKTAKEMTDKVLALEKRVQELNMENQFYKKLLIEKNGGELPVYRGVGEGDKL
ncbi:Similar to Regulatory protein cys-3; acc. no. P22697 [Pyronema omphalodes CBS 100304]|uniref:Similar to Regulatory protein cys-3 acc. no. P22697 n=1 Tax=Pyronema omphalodes (strain CBS 100304) TaxID=1076935 RepID=U4LJ56_PYROM|nr:Similar to Regulatory protein cys-3; acc. no. P22697 [Pyronema omphalodes CBS 100304]